jgi:hypothetical protein
MSKGLKLILLIVMTAVLAGLILDHVDGMNGPAYWQWQWRVRRGVVPYLLLLIVAVPAFLAQVRFAGRWGILLLMATTLGLEIANRGLDLPTFDLTRITTIIEEPGSIGYFTHAQEMIQRGQSVRRFLHDYLSLMPTFTLHARNKPPGSILFYVPFLKLAPDENSAALAAGLCIALLATLTVPATYWLALELIGSRKAAFQAAACMSLCPGLVLFLPEFDQFYPVYSCALIVLWNKALKTGRSVFAIAFGLLFAFVCFQTFNFLVLGVFLLGLTALRLIPSPGIPGEGEKTVHGLSCVLRQIVLAIGALVLVYALLWLWSGYNPIRTLRTGISLHNMDMPATHRVWPGTIPFDLTDFALGAGWVCALLAIYSIWTCLGLILFCSAITVRRDQTGAAWNCMGLLLLCLAQPVAVAISGVLAGETARVWLFMLPLLLIPAGAELASWPRGSRLTAMACLWLLTALLSQNMVFV